MNKKIILIVLFVISIVATLGTGCFVVGLKNSILESKNAQLSQEISNLNNVVNDLQNAIDQYQDKVSLVTYEVDGNVKKIEVVEKGATIELLQLEETDDQVFQGWQVDGKDDIFKTSYTVNQSVRLVANIVNREWVSIEPFVSGDNFWTDGENYYCSEGTTHYKLDKKSNTWKQTIWHGIDRFDGSKVWSDGENYYYSNTHVLASPGVWENIWYFDGSNYKLKEGYEFVAAEGSDVTNGDVWFAGEYIFDRNYSIWDAEANEWTDITWNINFNASDIWTDGKDYYLGTEYVLNLENMTWDEITMNSEGSNFNAGNIWTDGANLYCSFVNDNYDEHLKFDAKTRSWIKIETITKELFYYSFEARYIWTDENHAYYLNSGDRFIFDTETNQWVQWTPVFMNFAN